MFNHIFNNPGNGHKRRTTDNGLLTSHLSFRQERVRVDVLAVPEAFGVGDEPDGEVEVAVVASGVAAVADVAEEFAAPGEAVFGDAVGVAFEMRVIIDGAVVRAELIEGDAAAFAVEEFDHLAVGGGDDGRVARGHDVYGIVRAPRATRLGVGVLELFGTDARDRNQ